MAAPDTFQIVNTEGTEVNKEALKKIAKMVKPGPEYIKEVSSKIELYLRSKESKLASVKDSQLR